MKNIGRLICGAASTLVVGAIATGMLSGAAFSQTKEPIKFGLLMTLTGGGASPALANRLGVDMAIKEINDKGEMKPHAFVVEGQEVKLCCKSCLKDFNKDKAGYLKKIETEAKKQKK